MECILLNSLLRLIAFLLLTQIGYSQVKYEAIADTFLLEASKKIAEWNVGETELSPNWSPMIQKYLASVDIYKPASYCAAGQYYCFVEANKYFPKPKTIPIPKTAVANEIYNYGKKNGSKTIYEGKKHDFIVWRKRNSWQGHVERVIEVGKSGWVTTIGFNTGSGNPRDGDGVYKRKRNIYHPLGRDRKSVV